MTGLVPVGRENAAQKGRRLLAEGRLTVTRIEPWGLIVAECRGDSAESYVLGYDPKLHEWRCTCKAVGKCSHLVALQLVTKRPDR